MYDWIFSRELIGIVFSLIGLVLMLSGCYQWHWLWWDRGGYLPKKIGYNTTRLYSLITGTLIMGIGIALVLQSLWDTQSNIMYILVYPLVTLINARLYREISKESVLELIKSIFKRKAKEIE
jgi:hypothetical protein